MSSAAILPWRSLLPSLLRILKWLRADALRARLASQDDELKKLRRELDQARMKSAASAVSGAADQAVEIKGVKVLAQRVDALDRGQCERWSIICETSWARVSLCSARRMPKAR